METVAIVGPVDPVGRAALRARLTPDFDVIDVADESEYDRLAHVNYIVLRTLRLDGDAIRQCRNLRLVQRWGAGYDTVDIEAAGERGIPVSITHGINTTPVAEFTIMLILAVLRRLVTLDRNVRAGLWRDEALTASTFLLQGRTVGLLGYGNVGRQVGGYVRAFGADVIYHDVQPGIPEAPPAAVTPTSGSARRVTFDELVTQSDVLSLHLPLTDQSRGLVDAAVLRRMKSTAILVNTSRGGIVDERDLHQALVDGTILAAGLDVFESEPAPISNPLLGLENVVLSAHAAGNTADNSVRMAATCAEHVRAVSQGRDLPVRALVNRHLLRPPTSGEHATHPSPERQTS